ncbi:unnamed protein product [Cuscuta epithymum]|uniref:Uncharacterized protein n=1 Tax=Cuscuta epithymum TaxID=186058 RepID=A0AAV0D9Q5_9ASTE|nr:unnamed protein product [Cuscuta epithymum]
MRWSLAEKHDREEVTPVKIPLQTKIQNEKIEMNHIANYRRRPLAPYVFCSLVEEDLGARNVDFALRWSANRGYAEETWVVKERRGKWCFIFFR